MWGILSTNSVKESFELKNKEFLSCFVERGYPQDLVEKIFTDAQFSSRNTALKNEPKSSKKILPFVGTLNLANQDLKNTQIVAYRKVRCLKDSVVRAQLPSL